MFAGTGGPITLGNVRLFHSSAGGGTFEDDAKAQFTEILTYVPGTQPFFDSWIDDQPLGTCLVYNNLNESGGLGSQASTAARDGGSSITVKRPSGSLSVPENQGENKINSGNFLVPGAYTVTGTGYLLRCGCCDQALQIYYGPDDLEINGVYGSIENWREILLPLLRVSRRGKSLRADAIRRKKPGASRRP